MWLVHNHLVFRLFLFLRSWSGLYSLMRTFISWLLFICFIVLLFFCRCSLLFIPSSSVIFTAPVSLFPLDPSVYSLVFFFSSFISFSSSSSHLSYLCQLILFLFSFTAFSHMVSVFLSSSSLGPPPDCSPSQPVLWSLLPPLLQLTYSVLHLLISFFSSSSLPPLAFSLSLGIL